MFRNIWSASLFKQLLWFLFIYINLIANNSIYGKELVLNDHKIFDFASHLYRRGEYYRAISEYQRLKYFFPDSPLAEKSVLQIGKAYMAGGEVQEAVNHWQKQLKNVKLKQTNRHRIQTLLGLSFLEMDKKKTYGLRERNIQKALKNLSEVSGRSLDDKRVQNFVEDWESRPEPVYKSPLTAGAISTVIPGGGSFYTGRHMEGVYAFFVTGLFYLAAMDALRNQKKETAYCLFFFTLTFYGGNIYTAVNSAHKINDKMEADELLRLRKKHGMWFIPESDHYKGRF